MTISHRQGLVEEMRNTISKLVTPTATATKAKDATYVLVKRPLGRQRLSFGNATPLTPTSQDGLIEVANMRADNVHKQHSSLP